jgi:hypothetical protein
LGKFYKSEYGRPPNNLYANWTTIIYLFHDYGDQNLIANVQKWGYRKFWNWRVTKINNKKIYMQIK